MNIQRIAQRVAATAFNLVYGSGTTVDVILACGGRQQYDVATGTTNPVGASVFEFAALQYRGNQKAGMPPDKSEWLLIEGTKVPGVTIQESDLLTVNGIPWTIKEVDIDPAGATIKLLIVHG